MLVWVARLVWSWYSSLVGWKGKPKGNPAVLGCWQPLMEQEHPFVEFSFTGSQPKGITLSHSLCLVRMNTYPKVQVHHEDGLLGVQ